MEERKVATVLFADLAGSTGLADRQDPERTRILLERFYDAMAAEVAAAGGAFEFAEPITVEAKGKPAGVRCRRLIRALSLTRPRGVLGSAKAFVGRAEELERLLAAYRGAAAQRRPKLVTMIGDAGIGKSRLTQELWDQLPAEDPAPTRHAGRCLAYGRAITYWPLGEILRTHMGIMERDAPAEIMQRLGDGRILGLTLELDTAGDL